MNDPKSQPMFERCRDLEDKPDGPDRLSAIEASEIACKSARCALATGCLEVSSAEALIKRWEEEARYTNYRLVQATLNRCASDLRREMGAAKSRQPQDNTEMCNEPKNGGATS